MGNGLRMICKIYGGLKFKNPDGHEDAYIWDYQNDKPVLLSEINKRKDAEKELKRLERNKWMKLKKEIETDLFDHAKF